MKKNVILIITFLLFSIVLLNTQGQTTIWSEDFEGDWTANWHVDAGTWEIDTPTSGPGVAYTGEKCAATILAGNYPANANTRLIRHNSFTIPGIDQNPRLRFWHWYSISSGDQVTVQIKVGAEDWQTISEIYTSTGSNVWTYPSIDLSAFAGSTVQIAFYLTSDGSGFSVSSGWYVDDVTVITGPIVFNNPETWESGLGDWYCDRGTWEVGTPETGPGDAHTDQNCAATVLNGNYHANVSSRLISPQFTIPSADQNPRLRFWHWYSISSEDQATVQIKVGAEDWQTISDPYINTGGGVWTYPFIDLSAFAGSTVQIAFYLTSDGSGFSVSSGWYIDDIILEGFINTSIKNYVVEILNIYPNPFSNQTTIEFSNPDHSNFKLSVFSISGNIVFEMDNIISDNIVLKKGNLPIGIYFVELKGEKSFGKNMIIIK